MEPDLLWFVGLLIINVGTLVMIRKIFKNDDK